MNHSEKNAGISVLFDAEIIMKKPLNFIFRTATRLDKRIYQFKKKYGMSNKHITHTCYLLS
jgi:hypothetical protein